VRYPGAFARSSKAGREEQYRADYELWRLDVLCQKRGGVRGSWQRPRSSEPRDPRPTWAKGPFIAFTGRIMTHGYLGHLRGQC
jgi:hypothetical protein